MAAANRNDIYVLREVVKKLIPMLVQCNIKVTQMGTEAYVKTNTRTKQPVSINIPAITDDAEADFILAIQGFLDHDKTAIDDFERELEDIDAILERTNKILENPETLEIKPNRLKQLLKPKNQDEIWEKWQEVIKSTQHEPPILRSAILLDAWINLDPIPNKPWLGFEYANAALRVDLSLDYLPSITTGLRQIPLNARKNHNRLKRLKAYIDAYALSSEQAIRNAHKIKVHYERLQERTENIRAGSKTKAFIDYAIATPVVTTTNAAAALNISPAGVLKILKTLQLREITGRSRYRAWMI